MEDIKYEGINISAMQRNMKVLQNAIKQQNQINLKQADEIRKLKQVNMTSDNYDDFISGIMKKAKMK